MWGVGIKSSGPATYDIYITEKTQTVVFLLVTVTVIGFMIITS
jgi:hypothetical protein